MTPKDRTVSIVVTLSDNAIHEAARIGRLLSETGMTIETPLEELGQFIGTSSSQNIQHLSAIDGVQAVEELGEVRLPPSPQDPQ